MDSAAPATSSSSKRESLPASAAPVASSSSSSSLSTAAAPAAIARMDQSDTQPAGEQSQASGDTSMESNSAPSATLLTQDSQAQHAPVATTASSSNESSARSRGGNEEVAAQGAAVASETTSSQGDAAAETSSSLAQPPDEYPSFSGGFVPPSAGQESFSLAPAPATVAAVAPPAHPEPTSAAAAAPQLSSITSRLSTTSVSDIQATGSTGATASSSSTTSASAMARTASSSSSASSQRRRSSSADRARQQRASTSSSSSSTNNAGATGGGGFTPLRGSASWDSSSSANRLSVRKSKTSAAWDPTSRPPSYALVPLKVRDYAFPETDPRHVGARDVSASQSRTGRSGRFHLREESGEVEEEEDDDDAGVGGGLNRWRRPAGGGSSSGGGDDWGATAGYDDEDEEFEGDEGHRRASLEDALPSSSSAGSGRTGGSGVPMSVDSLAPGTYRVLYDFDAEEEHELSCRVGDHVEVVGSIEGGWAVGKKRQAASNEGESTESASSAATGREGLVPEGYLEWVGAGGSDAGVGVGGGEATS